MLGLTFVKELAFAETCEFNDSNFGRIDGQISEMKLPGDSSITVIEEEPLTEDARAGAASLFTERPRSAEDLADRVGLFLSANQDTFDIAQRNLNFLHTSLLSPHPPGFVAVGVSSNKLAYLRKAATILSLYRYAQVNELGVRNAQWDKLLLFIVGPVVYLRTREPELFHSTALMAMDDQGLAPFHAALEWQEQKIPEWMEKLVGRGGIKETGDINVGGTGKIPEGNGIFLLSNGSMPAVSSALRSACEKLRATPTPGAVPAKIEQENNIQMATEEIPVAPVEEERRQSASRTNGWNRRIDTYKATKETNPEVARKNAMARHALAYSWMTIDGAGHRWVHIRPIHNSQKE